jgi:hypothetical protein
MIKRPGKAAALPYSTCCHTFRATGKALIWRMAAHWARPDHCDHESPRTTKLYNRTREELTAEEIGRIKI